MTSRLDPKQRTDHITAVALKLAEDVAGGYRALSREDIAKGAGVSPALVSARLGTMENVRRAIMRAAIKAKCLKVIAQGLAVGDPHAKKAPEELRQQAAAIIAG